MTLRALDLFCCQGGASEGLRRAGYEVTGVDIAPQPRYPFRFIRADALEVDLRGFDLIWASPPCQAFSIATPRALREFHQRLIEPVRERLQQCGAPWVIENVPGAPIRPDLKLHGAMFGLPMHRDRWFESSELLLAPTTRRHARDGATRGGKKGGGRLLMLVGSFVGAPRAREVLGLPWMNRYGLAQCVPPQYAEFIGRQIACQSATKAAA